MNREGYLLILAHVHVHDQCFVFPSREESFFDLQLNVKGNRSCKYTSCKAFMTLILNTCISILFNVCSIYNLIVHESFKNYTSPETLDGDNKYSAGNHGMQVHMYRSMGYFHRCKFCENVIFH